MPSIAVHIESPIPLEVKRLEVELWEKEDNAKIVFVKGLYPFFDAVCLFWIGEIHIDERYKDSKTLDDLVKHELMHYKLIKRARKYIEEGKILKAFAFAILNGIFDIYDTLRIELKELILKCRKNKMESYLLERLSQASNKSKQVLIKEIKDLAKELNINLRETEK